MYEKFIKLIKQRNLSVYRVSKMSGIAQSVFSDWKYRQDGNLSIDNLKKLAAALEVPITYFLED